MTLIAINAKTRLKQGPVTFWYFFFFFFINEDFVTKVVLYFEAEFLTPVSLVFFDVPDFLRYFIRILIFDSLVVR